MKNIKKLIYIAVLQVLGPKWAQMLNTNFNVIDSHNHNAENGVKITPASLNIDEDLSTNGNALVGADRISLSGDTVEEHGPGAISLGNGDLYYENYGGATIQLTSGDDVLSSTDGISRNSPSVTLTTSTVLDAATAEVMYSLEASASLEVTLPVVNDMPDGSILTFKDALGTAETYEIKITAASGDSIDADASVIMIKNLQMVYLVKTDSTTWSQTEIPAQLTTQAFNNSAVINSKLPDEVVTSDKRAPLTFRRSVPTSSQTITLSTTPQTVSGLSVTIPKTSRPVKLALYSSSGSTVELGGSVKRALTNKQNVIYTISKNGTPVASGMLGSSKEVLNSGGGSYVGPVFSSAQGNGRVIMITNTNCRVSTDGGITWTAGTTPNPSGRGAVIAYGAGMFFGAPTSPDGSLGSDTYIGSDTGLSWSSTSAAMGGFGGAAYSPVHNTFIFMTEWGTTARTWTTPSGGVSSMFTNTTASGGFAVKRNALEWGNGVWMGIASNNTIRISTSNVGNGWTSYSQPLTDPKSIIYGSDRWMMVGTNQAAYSTNNGASWTTVSIPTGNWHRVSWTGTSFIATASGTSGRVAVSTGGDFETIGSMSGGAFYEAYSNGNTVAIINGSGSSGFVKEVSDASYIPEMIQYIDSSSTVGSATYTISFSTDSSNAGDTLEVNSLYLMAYEI